MAVIGMDLGGTKLAAAIFSNEGIISGETTVMLEEREGYEVGTLIAEVAGTLLDSRKGVSERIDSIGICIPGIYRSSTGCVWAPNIPGWDDFPLSEMLGKAFAEKNPGICIDSDRACCILGETWKGIARDCTNAIFISVGTGIGAGILCDGRIIRGHSDIAGATGWMALTPYFTEEYRACGCLEYHTSGRGLARAANKVFNGSFNNAAEVFEAYDIGDPAAVKAVEEAIILWGMASANLVSLFNPEVVIFGGGVFGPASRFLERIRKEAARWAQPVSMAQVRFEVSSLGGRAGLMGAGKLALSLTGMNQ